MSKQDYELVSAASVNIGSRVKLKAISPKNSTFKTVGVIMSVDDAIILARNILILAENKEINGDFVFTGFRKGMSLSINRYRNYNRDM